MQLARKKHVQINVKDIAHLRPNIRVKAFALRATSAWMQLARKKHAKKNAKDIVHLRPNIRVKAYALIAASA